MIFTELNKYKTPYPKRNLSTLFPLKFKDVFLKFSTATAPTRFTKL